jgi:hypothetical protein
MSYKKSGYGGVVCQETNMGASAALLHPLKEESDVDVVSHPRFA